ncbi:MAG: SDR family NAD(P)-dependent oxidoreductase [Thermacetogeniaceae bacterium]|jgi:NAD(P)-dependent dehydrogenase (short-subunit alcohol dehydrogenase family)|nr:SDR family oxidoreductase [Thermoanaerobacterales bacterium]NLN20549.1 SDR family oxidoreductase [Syntrophomonadaceae bacterium]
MDRMKGKIAVVTGVASGIGKAIAEMFAAEGAKVVGADYDAENGQKTIDGIKAKGGEAIFVAANLRKKEDVENLKKVALDTYGTITTLVNAAGVLVHAPFLEHTDEDYDKISETNFRAYCWTMQAFLPVMVENPEQCSVCNIASISSIKPESNAYYYGAFKAAVDLMTRNLSREFSPKGVRLNVICPGPVFTNMTPQEVINSPEIQAEMCKNVCSIGRLGEPEDIAYAATYLCSDEASWVTGIHLVVDGGACMMG